VFWSISNGKAILTNPPVNGYNLEQLYLDGTHWLAESGKTYKITYEILANDDEENFAVKSQFHNNTSGNTAAVEHGTVGVHSDYITADEGLASPDGYFMIQSAGQSSIWDGSIHIDNISVREAEQWQLVEGTADVAASVECEATKTATQYLLDWTTDDLDPQLRIYKDAGNNHYVKPNEALELGNINEGKYQLQFDFLHNPYYVYGTDSVTFPERTYYFYITEVSPSRKEVRLVTRDGANDRVPAVADIEIWSNQIDNVLLNHNFNFVLVISNARNIPIVNYKIDKVSDPANPSLILKLYSPLPTDVTRLANVTIEQEIFTTQVEDIWYRTEAYIDHVYGYGLDYDPLGGLLGYEDVG